MANTGGKFNDLATFGSNSSIEVAAALLNDSNEVMIASAAGAPKKITRREEITGLVGSEAKTGLTQQEKKEIGGWLGKHYDRLKNAGIESDGIEKEDLIESYSSARWNDKSKFLWSDMRMLKRVASHFDELALAGASPQSIETEDVDGLKRGATVKRTEQDVTTTFPDGEMNRRTVRGELLKKGADGSLTFESAAFKMELKADATGYMSFKMPDQASILGKDSIDVPLVRGKNGLWTGQLDGEELQLAVDDHSVHMQSDSFDVLLTSTGGYMRDPTDPESMMIINADGSVNIRENGKVANIGVNNDNGIMMALDSDGGRVVQYPFAVEYWSDGNGAQGIKSDRMLPSVSVTPDGTMTVHTQNSVPAVEVKPDADGNAQHSLANGIIVKHEKSGKFSFERPVDPENSVTIEITADGVFSISVFDQKEEHKPPELRRPPAIR